MISTNATGEYMANLNCGHSMVIDPEGMLMWEAGENPCNAVITLDLTMTGSLFHIFIFNLPICSIVPYRLKIPGRFSHIPLHRCSESLPETRRQSV